MLQRKLDSSNQETEFVAGIVTSSFKAQGIKWPLLEKRAHRVGNLNLSDSARLGLLNLVENVGRQYVAPNDCQVRRRFSKGRLLDHVLDLINTVFHFFTVDSAKTRNSLAFYLKNSDDG